MGVPPRPLDNLMMQGVLAERPRPLTPSFHPVTSLPPFLLPPAGLQFLLVPPHTWHTEAALLSSPLLCSSVPAPLHLCSCRSAGVSVRLGWPRICLRFGAQPPQAALHTQTSLFRACSLPPPLSHGYISLSFQQLSSFSLDVIAGRYMGSPHVCEPFSDLPRPPFLYKTLSE